jgi:alkaline phosphatase
MTRVAVSGLNKNINGYFLVVEHGLVARAAGQNGGTLTANEVGEVDEAIQTAVAYAGPDALVLVTNNYSLGGSGPQAAPTAEPAWLASRGQGSAQLRGFINNTDVYDIVSENF